MIRQLRQAVYNRTTKKKKEISFFQFQDFYRKEIEVDGEPAYLEILDTAGSLEFILSRRIREIRCF